MTLREELMAATLWRWLRWSMPRCENLEWAEVNRGSAAWEITRDAARAALKAAVSPLPSID